MKKINNLKITKKMIALLMAGTMALTFSGCDSNNSNISLLDGTILEDALVITFEDGSKDIAIATNSCGHIDSHYYFESIVSGLEYVSDKCSSNYKTRQKYAIQSNESIVKYITAEEIAKANKEGLTDDDINNIISRIFSESEKEIQKTK